MLQYCCLLPVVRIACSKAVNSKLPSCVYNNGELASHKAKIMQVTIMTWCGDNAHSFCCRRSTPKLTCCWHIFFCTIGCWQHWIFCHIQCTLGSASAGLQAQMLCAQRRFPSSTTAKQQALLAGNFCKRNHACKRLTSLAMSYFLLSQKLQTHACVALDFTELKLQKKITLLSCIKNAWCLRILPANVKSSLHNRFHLIKVFYVEVKLYTIIGITGNFLLEMFNKKKLFYLCKCHVYFMKKYFK